MGQFIPLDIPLPFASVYPLQTGVVVEWPPIVVYREHTYYPYGKVGRNLITGLPCACYRREGDERIWIACDGSITED